MADFNERRAKIDAAAIHGNPQFGKDQLDALKAQSLNDIAEALTALVGILGDLGDRLGGWQRIGIVDDGALHADAGLIPRDKLAPVSGPDDEQPDDEPVSDGTDELPDEPLDVGDYVVTAASGELLGTVTATGVSEGRAWVTVDDGTDEGTGKVWADQLMRVSPPAPLETAATNPEDGMELRRKAAESHIASTEPKVEYEAPVFDAGESDEFDVPIGMVGAPVKVKSKGGK